jgi:SAM-dependent methyltransferase
MDDGRWQVTGGAAQVYERQLVPAIFGPWAPRVLDLAAPATGERVLGSACGTGVVARLAADRVGLSGQVVGQDLNPGMLAVASALPAREAPIAWVQASTGRLPFAGGSFEVVACQLGLQYFPDRPVAVAEMARVLAPGGRLAAMVWRSIDHSPGFAALADLLDRHIGPATGATMRAPFALHDEGDRTENTEAAEALTVDAIAGTPMEQDYRAKSPNLEKLQELLDKLGQFDAGSPAGPTLTSRDRRADADHRW